MKESLRAFACGTARNESKRSPTYNDQPQREILLTFNLKALLFEFMFENLLFHVLK